MLGKSILTGYISLSGIYLLLKVLGISGIHAVLGGLQTYVLPDPADAPSAAPEPKGKKVKKSGKQNVQVAGTSESITVTTLSARALLGLPFADDINTLVTLVLTSLANAGLVLVLAVGLGADGGAMTVGVCLLTVLYVLMVMYKVDYANVKGLGNALTALAILVVGAGLSFLVLTVAPRYQVVVGMPPRHEQYVQWDVSKAARGLDAIVDILHARVASRMEVRVSPLRVPPLYLAAVVSLWGGVIAVCMLGPGLQYARALYSSLHVPQWARSHASRGWFGLTVMRLALVAALAVVVSQVPALTGHLGVLSPAGQQVLTGCLLLVAALLHWLSISPMAQTYLDRGLLDWFKFLHDGKDFQGKGKLVQQRLSVQRVLLGKLGVQFMALPTLTLSCALLLLLHSTALNQAVEHFAAPRAQLLARLPEPVLHLLNVSAHPVPPTARPPSLLDVAAPAVVDAAAPTPAANELLGLTDDGSAVSVPSPQAGATAVTRPPLAPLPPGQVSDLWVFLSTFLGWWSCVAWSVYAIMWMTVSRLGWNSG